MEGKRLLEIKDLHTVFHTDRTVVGMEHRVQILALKKSFPLHW